MYQITVLCSFALCHSECHAFTLSRQQRYDVVKHQFQMMCSVLLALLQRHSTVLLGISSIHGLIYLKIDLRFLFTGLDRVGQFFQCTVSVGVAAKNK